MGPVAGSDLLEEAEAVFQRRKGNAVALEDRRVRRGAPQHRAMPRDKREREVCNGIQRSIPRLESPILEGQRPLFQGITRCILL